MNIIQVFAPPVAGFSLPDTTSCLPLNLSPQDLSSGVDAPIVSWRWQFGNGDTAMTQEPSYSYQIADQYQVALMVTDQNGCSDTSSLGVEAFAIPQANFVASDTLGCAPDDIRFTDLSTSQPVQWAWKFGDGDTSTQSQPLHTYAQEGIYTVSLEVTDIHGCQDQHTKLNYIVLQNPTADFVAQYDPGCPPLAVTFFPVGSGLKGIANWRWDFGDGQQATSLKDSLVYTYTAPGVYDVSLIATDSLGCTVQVDKPGLINVIGDIIPDPVDIHAISVMSDNQIEIKWEATLDQDFYSYQVYREDPTTGYELVYSTSYVNDTSWVDPGVNTREQAYCYKVTVTNYCGTESALNLARHHCSIEVEAQPLPGQIVVEWTPYLGWPVEQYEIYRVNSYNTLDVNFI
ncbi:MAG: PKD domain-containing protein, partial [Bacteroidota bacterium]